MKVGTQLSFERTPALMAHFTQVRVGEETARVITEAAGRALEELHAETVAALERDLPPVPPGPPVQLLSADGAMVPLVGGTWGEVKTLVIGRVTAGQEAHGQAVARAVELSYCSCLADAQEFGTRAWGELHRRGTERADQVCAVMDGAEWLQGFVDRYRPDAVRILDYVHATGHLAEAAHVVFSHDPRRAAEWLAIQKTDLLEHDPATVVAALGALPIAEAGDPTEAAEVRDRVRQYLEKRAGQLRYADFRAQGYPIGSGSVESANKLVVEARLKGAGMRWARPNVNPMLALRTMLLSERWDELWLPIWRRLRAQAGARRRARCRTRPPSVPTPTPDAAEAVPVPLAEPAHVPVGGCSPRPQARMVNGRPAPSHPWRRDSLRSRKPQTAAAHQES